MTIESVFLILLIIEGIFYLYFAFGTFYFIIFSIAGLLPYSPPSRKSEKLRKFVVLIPGYKEDAVIVEVARHATLQDYPAELFEVIVIADSFQPSTLEGLRQVPVRVIEVSFDKSSKSRALNKAMSQLTEPYDSVIILDADNLMEPGCISAMNDSLNRGFMAVQGHRTAKNRNTSFAILDSVSEEINNHIFRKGHRVAGLSSALIGSGMAFDYQLFKNYMATIDSFGEDKELEIKLLKDKHRIEYCENAHILDEKVQKSHVFMVQRTRWLANQFLYARTYFLLSMKELFLRGNIDLADKVVQQFLPPRIFLLGFLTIFSVFSVIFQEPQIYLAWLILFGISILSLLISIPGRLYTIDTLKAALMLPKGFVFMLFSLFRIFKAKRSFGHTTHSVAEKKL